jgi:hypothetical protein
MQEEALVSLGGWLYNGEGPMHLHADMTAQTLPRDALLHFAPLYFAKMMACL